MDLFLFILTKTNLYQQSKFSDSYLVFLSGNFYTVAVLEFFNCTYLVFLCVNVHTCMYVNICIYMSENNSEELALSALCRSQRFTLVMRFVGKCFYVLSHAAGPRGGLFLLICILFQNFKPPHQNGQIKSENEKLCIDF